MMCNYLYSYFYSIPNIIIANKKYGNKVESTKPDARIVRSCFENELETRLGILKT